MDAIANGPRVIYTKPKIEDFAAKKHERDQNGKFGNTKAPIRKKVPSASRGPPNARKLVPHPWQAPQPLGQEGN